MSSIVLIAISLSIFFFGYNIYSKKFEKLFKIDPARKTPAFSKYDGIDYVPAKHWTMLFGHHFASIAGAAPIIGPVLALSIWGWAPSVIWILLGTVFIGGIHDYAALIISVKHGGTSIADIAKDSISKNAKIVFLAFLWLALILVISVFANICARTFIVKPEIVVPSLSLIPIAVFVGILLYYMKMRQSMATVIGLGLFAGAMILGKYIPIELGANAMQIWTVFLLAYAFIASITPVNILLQPRDYLASYLLVIGVILGYAGIIISRPEITFPAFIGWGKSEGLMLWPILFVTVACGAVSGFHSVVASGTTSKQIANEKDARKIGYGAMVAEGIIAIMAVLVVAAAFKDKNVLREIVDRGAGPVGAFGIGYSEVTKRFMGSFGGIFAIMILNSFILTTLDTATRITRYLTQELFGIKNRIAATLIVVALAGWLGLNGQWNEIWPMFGAANQLIAALALIVISSWLLSRRKALLYTLVPMVFMLFTATTALVLKIIEYSKSGSAVLLVVAIVLLGLACFVIFEAVLAIRRIMRVRRNLFGAKGKHTKKGRR